MAAYDSLMVFTGTANPDLAQKVVKHLDISLGRADVGRFSDGEVAVELLENVRGRDVFVLQSTCQPTNDNLMEVLTMVDALKRSSAGRITAAIPLLWLCPPRPPPPFGACAYFGQIGRQYAHLRRH